MISITRVLSDLGLSGSLLLGLVTASTLTMAEPLEQPSTTPLAGLSSLRWRYRIIVVDAQISDAVERLQAGQEAISERDILWFVPDQRQLHTNYQGPIDARLIAELERRYFSRSDAAVFLIGKDGGLKASAPHLDLPALFRRIDAMPMRRREMEAAD
jgi:hypothetical protein